MNALEIELFTSDHAIRGFLDTAGERLSDVMNNQKESSILLSDVFIIRLVSAGKNPPAKMSLANISKDKILFARPVQQDLTHKSLYRRAARQMFQVAFNLPGFEVQGVIHLPGKLDVARVFIERPEDFVPVTNGRAIYTYNPRLEVVSSVFIINKHQVSMLAEIPPSSDYGKKSALAE